MLSVVNILPSGSRGNIILTVFLIVMPLIIVQQRRIRISKKTKKYLFVALFSLVTVLKSTRERLKRSCFGEI